MAVFAMAGLGFGGQAMAQSCDIVPIVETPVSAPGGTDLNYVFQAQGACDPVVTGTITVISGGATVAPLTFSVPEATDFPFTITLPAGGGLNGTVQVACNSGGCGLGNAYDFDYATDNDFDYTPIGGNTVVTSQIASFTLGTNLQLNGAPGGVASNFNNLTTPANYGQITPDGSGNATTAPISLTTANTYVVRASLACPVTFVLPGCSAVPPVDFTVIVEPAGVQFVGSGTENTTVGTPVNLAVTYGSASIPAVDGTPMTWSVTGGPAGGDGVVTGNAVAGGGGQSDAVFSATVPGTYQVTANSGCTFCAPGLRTFTVVVATVPTLVINSGDGQTTQVGSTFPAVLSVHALNSGLPAGGVTIDWLVTTGTANITPSGPTDFTAGEAHLSVTPTSVGPIVITATRQDAPAATVTFNLTATALPSTLTAVSANPATGSVGASIPFTVLVETGGVPVNGASIDWVASAPFTPANITTASNPAGEASANFTASAAGSFVGAVTAQYDPDGIPANGDEISLSFDANIAAVPGLAITAGNGQTTTEGSNFAVDLAVLADNSGVPATGVGINWLVTGGSATIVPSGATDGSGAATATVTADAAGAITITATRADAPGATVTFNLTATALPFVLNPVSANPAAGTVGTPMAFTVRLLQGAAPVNAANIQWTAAAPFAPGALVSATNAAGDAIASFTPSAAGSFAGAVQALYDPDGVAGNGDEVSFAFDANVAFVAALNATGGGGQSALVNTAFAAPLSVNAQNSGVPAATVTIDWQVSSGSAVLSAATSVTNAAGDTSINVTAGPTAGPVVITASRQDDPTATASFTLAVDALGSLSIVAGDGQTLAAGITSAPMQVELKDAGGVPVAGATINWSTTTGSLASATSTTNAAGIASNTVVVSTAGAVEVTASSPLALAPALFAHNGGLGNLAGLTPRQKVVADAIDDFCPALAALPSRSPGQDDLLQRCRELTDASGLDPDATVDAIDQLVGDVALTQANAAFAALHSQFQNLKTRIAALRSGTGGTSFGGLALNTPAGPVSLGLLANAFGADSDPAEVGGDFSRWGFFLAGTIGRGENDATSRNPAFDYDVEGVTAGLDYRKSDKWIIGGSLGYTRQDTGLPGDRGGLDTSGWTVSAYTTYYQQDSWYLDSVLTWGRNDYELLRNIRYTLPLPGGGTSTVDQTARADASGDLLATAFTFGRDFNRGALGIGPYGRLLYTRVGFDDINETLVAGLPGSGLGLSIENRDISSVASVLGTKFTYTFSTDWGVLMPHLQLEWEHEFKDDPQAIEARFINDPTGSAMAMRGDPLDSDYFRLGLGMSMVLTRGRSGFFYYERLVGRNGMSQYNLALGLRMEF